MSPSLCRLLCALCLLGVLAAVPPVAAFPEEAVWTYELPADELSERGGYLRVVNREKLLESDYVPPNLTTLSLRSVDGPAQLRREAAAALEGMFRAAEAAGFALYVKSAYRSYQTQATMYFNRLEKLGRDDGVVAYPGSSDHQTGLGVDILNREWTLKEGMTPAFGDTAEAKWLEEHCFEFGFILRYMPEKREITGIIYEPWHFRYVGKAAARRIMENRLSLEEFEAEYLQAIREYEKAGGDFAALLSRLTALPSPVSLEEADAGGDRELSLFYEKP